MIGDPLRLLNAVRHPGNLRRAYKYAVRDRRKGDHYYDPFELDYAHSNRDQILTELTQELSDVGRYTPRPSYAYYTPKTELCFRRMIYIPLKDLVVRYGFVTVLADLLDEHLSNSCFANRRARGERAKEAFLEDFATTSWPGFCSWQKQCATRLPTLLRTDISAFYDSVAHDYLVDTIARELVIDSDTPLMALFRSVLRVPVISYSHLSRRPREPEVLQQGLPIGNTTEGVLANLYLKTVDQQMSQLRGVEFGRYNDDMRIFAPTRLDAERAVLILQEHLLGKGLNLSVSKTEIAETERDVRELRSKAYQVSGELLDEETGLETGLDRPFEEFSRVFSPGEELKKAKDAKEFCLFMQHRRETQRDLLPMEERQPEHVATLEEILNRWRGSSKHAAWLLAECACGSECIPETRECARDTLLRCLTAEEVATYAKYRLLHHLTKLRQVPSGGADFRFLDRLSADDKKRLDQLLPSLLEAPAFELNISALYALMAIGHPAKALQSMVRDHVPEPSAPPIANTLLSLTGLPTAVRIARSASHTPSSVAAKAD